MHVADRDQNDGKNAGRLLAAMALPVRRALQAASALSVFASLLWIAQAALVAWALSALLAPGGMVEAAIAAGGFALIGLVRAGLGFVAEGISFRAAEKIVVARRKEIVARESLRRRNGTAGSAAIAALAAEKLDLIEPYLTRYAPARMRVAVVPIVILAIAFALSWAVGLVLLVSGPLIPVFMALVGMAAKEASERQMQKIGSLNDLLSERLSALIDIRLLDAGDAVVAGFRHEADSLRQRTMEVLRIAFLSSTVLELFSAIGVAMVAVYVGFSLLGQLGFGAYATPLTAAEGIFLLLLAPDYFQPMRDLSAAWHDKASAEAVAGELAGWQEAEAGQILGTGDPQPALAGPAHIALRGLTLRLPDGRDLRFPDLDIPAGTSIAITGASGAGKTTLLSLLAGLQQPAGGAILVAGRPLADNTADAWRARLGWVPQAPRFLNASLRRNITLGALYDPARLSGALATAAVGDVVAAAPRGLQTRLGEAGGGLSGGEGRRLTVARAAYAGADVLLADEPTADLDAETARAVADGLMALSRAGATLIVATHDAALAARMDRQVSLEAG